MVIADSLRIKEKSWIYTSHENGILILFSSSTFAVSFKCWLWCLQRSNKSPHNCQGSCLSTNQYRTCWRERTHHSRAANHICPLRICADEKWEWWLSKSTRNTRQSTGRVWIPNQSFPDSPTDTVLVYGVRRGETSILKRGCIVPDLWNTVTKLFP